MNEETKIDSDIEIKADDSEEKSDRNIENDTIDASEPAAFTDDAEKHGEHEHQHEHHHHHHHHHHHRHTHSRRHSTPKKKNGKAARFFKKNKSLLLNILLAVISIVLLLLLAKSYSDRDRSSTDITQTATHDITRSTVKIETSVFSEDVRLVSDAVAQFCQSDNTLSALDIYKANEGYKSKLNTGLSVNFIYGVTGLPSGYSVTDITLALSEHIDGTDPSFYTLSVDGTSIELYNLKTGTKYYYTVSLVLSEGDAIQTAGSFTTEKSPRILNVDGIRNVRDIGAWTTDDGKTVRQGLLYRGSEIDGAYDSDLKITDLGLQQLKALGIRYDMDLRLPNEQTQGCELLGNDVIHQFYSVDMYADIFNDEEKIKEIFCALANPDHYPMYLHCTYGRDRTGTVCYLLEALLGVSDRDLRREYDLSAFTDSFADTARFNSLIEQVSAFEGKTTKDKVEGYLLKIGVTQEQIQSIRDIFLGE